jgi:hypothetical protein
MLCGNTEKIRLSESWISAVLVLSVEKYLEDAVIIMCDGNR